MLVLVLESAVSAGPRLRGREEKEQEWQGQGAERGLDGRLRHAWDSESFM